jgi:hypothetical protein
MAKYKKPSDMIRAVDKKMDQAMARLLFKTQDRLSRSAPRDTGRLASSFFIGKNQPERYVEPPRKEPGPVTVERGYNPLEITCDDDWYISSNLPYSVIAAFSPGYVGRSGGGRGDWYTAIVNQLPADSERIFTQELGKL